ncbi:unnamed protein product [Porites evermanni]|uniref:Methyltransferase domain-containing protein n=1 Tax=Porites evermanni TaxID=104178 RepID=A0ABN8SI85_9CNID|nr:unnamed protein product [Porites evermanni]
MSSVNKDLPKRKCQVADLEEAVENMRRLTKEKPRIGFLGKEFLIYPEVFHPDPWHEIIAYVNKEVIEVIKTKLLMKFEDAPFNFLEVGCGAGYIAINAALISHQCRAWATDINPTAVKNTVENAKLHGVDDRVIAVTADVFDHKEIAGKKFDMIYWNCPRDDQHPSPGNEVELLMRSLTDPGYQALRRFLSQARIFLKDSGCVFLGFSLTFGSKELFEKVVAETKWRYKIYSRKIFPLSLGSEHKEETRADNKRIQQGNKVQVFLACGEAARKTSGTERCFLPSPLTFALFYRITFTPIRLKVSDCDQVGRQVKKCPKTHLILSKTSSSLKFISLRAIMTGSQGSSP